MRVLLVIVLAFGIAFAATSCGSGGKKNDTGAATNQPAPVPTGATNPGTPGGTGPATSTSG